MSAWTTEQTDMAKTLWLRGKSARHIGGLIGKTRNAVIGRARRMGWKQGVEMKSVVITKEMLEATRLQGTPGGIIQRVALAREAPVREEHRSLRGNAWSPLEWSKPVSLVEHTGCKWPTTSGWCNEPKHGHVYCEDHEKLAYRVREPA